MNRLVVVTGLSGAGKSQAMKSFEDLGFSCIDNLPPPLLGQAITLARANGITHLAIAPDVHRQGVVTDVLAAMQLLKADAIPAELLFLDTTDEVLIRRYSETRRRHPFGEVGHLGEAIAAERVSLAALRDCADLQWDTSSLTLTSLKAKIAATFGSTTTHRLAILVIAFGFKYGLPLDADLVFDVRFLPNPNYEPALQPLSGADPAVAAFLEAIPQTEPLLAHLTDLLDFLVPQYLAEGKSHLAIAIGCTGGRHRSVYIGRRLVAHLGERSGIAVGFTARDLHR